MSNYYKYHCLSCDDSYTPSNLNNGWSSQCAVLRHAKEIAALGPLFAEPSIFTIDFNFGDGHQLPFQFLRDHVGHHLVVMSEYGDHYFETNETRVEVPKRG